MNRHYVRVPLEVHASYFGDPLPERGSATCHPPLLSAIILELDQVTTRVQREYLQETTNNAGDTVA